MDTSTSNVVSSATKVVLETRKNQFVKTMGFLDFKENKIKPFNLVYPNQAIFIFKPRDRFSMFYSDFCKKI